MMITTIAVGSTNPAKVEAVRRVAAQAFPGASVHAREVPSGVRPQPVGEAETRRGALSRARAALARTGADLGVGCEGGVALLRAPGAARGGLPFLTNWAAVVGRDGRVGLGRGPGLMLPPLFRERLPGGGELGPLIDGLSGTPDSRTESGAIGWLTRGLVDRRHLWEVAVACALAPFLRPEAFPRDQAPDRAQN